MPKRRQRQLPDNQVLIEFSLDGTPDRLLPDLIEREIFAIGYVTCQWAYLEHMVFAVTLQLARQSRVAVPSDAKNKSFSRRLRAWRVLIQRSKSKRKERLLKLASTIANLESKRHQITHGLWSYEPKSIHRLIAYSFRPTVEFHEPYDADKIMKLGNKIGEINFELTYPGGKREAQKNWAKTMSELGSYVSRSWLLSLREKGRENQGLPPAIPPEHKPPQSPSKE
jgi:hypothetical protein